MRHASALRNMGGFDDNEPLELPTPQIKHNPGPGLGKPAGGEAPPKIRAFEQKIGGSKEEQWSRKPNSTGTGACHCKTFHCKMADEGLSHLDQMINEWLDQHPEYEVKNVTMCCGEWKGKITEPQLIVQVWV
ncbi:MAG: hypothetical protein KF866_05210 [Phycisphaeraceae bacterium]|nr:hypothetical protein [Phycisphaeraceae bacterium]MCW5754392.1 hypothetical protein [Phycisphaeraceae bacterium]